MKSRVELRKIEENDLKSIIDMNIKSEAFHFPWVKPPKNKKDFEVFYAKSQTEKFQTYTISNKQDNKVIGIINLSEIVRGVFQNAYISYYIHIDYQKKVFLKKLYYFSFLSFLSNSSYIDWKQIFKQPILLPLL